MSWNSNAPIRFKLGSVALWNIMQKSHINKRDYATLAYLSERASAFYKDLSEAPRPVAMGDPR